MAIRKIAPISITSFPSIYSRLISVVWIELLYKIRQLVVLTRLWRAASKLLTSGGANVHLIHLELVRLVSELTSRIHSKSDCPESRPVGLQSTRCTLAGSQSWDLEQDSASGDSSNVFRDTTSALTSFDTEGSLSSGKCSVYVHSELALLTNLFLYHFFGCLQLFGSDTHRSLSDESLPHLYIRVDD